VPKVLIVDDDADSRAVLIDVFDGQGYAVSEAANGPDALRAVAEDPPDLVLLDVMMPKEDGLEVCRRLQECADTRSIPVIMITALAREQDILAGLEAGATDYVTKPFRGGVVRARVRTALRSKLAQDEVRQLAAQVAAKNRKLAELVETAHRVVDDVSHDFRTPLTVINEFAKIIADGLGGPVTDPQQEYLQIITNAVADLTRMVDDFLDSSKLKAGALRVDRQPHRVEDIMEAVRPMIASKAKAKGIEVTEHIEPGLPTVFADKEKAGRIILNLAVNAIKFSPKGSEVSLWAKSCGSGDIEIGLTDQGRGLSPEDLNVIFERFTQAGHSAASNGKGFGLGLSIVKELTDLSLGEVRVESEPGQGSTFSFTLPRAEAPVILARYFDWLAKTPGALDQIAVLRVTPKASEADRQDVRMFLTSTCYPMDLILDGNDVASLVAIGLTSEPGRWADRLQSEWTGMIRSSPGHRHSEIRIDHIGSWSLGRQRDRAIPSLLRELTGHESYAQESSHR
jgi:signal transduction histidine kinase